jgi:hypothetical protein
MSDETEAKILSGNEISKWVTKHDVDKRNSRVLENPRVHRSVAFRIYRDEHSGR